MTNYLICASTLHPHWMICAFSKVYLFLISTQIYWSRLCLSLVCTCSSTLKSQCECWVIQTIRQLETSRWHCSCKIGATFGLISNHKNCIRKHCMLPMVMYFPTNNLEIEGTVSFKNNANSVADPAFYPRTETEVQIITYCWFHRCWFLL